MPENLHMLLTARYLLPALACAGALWMLYEYARPRKHRLAAVLCGTGSGIAALLLLHRYGGTLGFEPALNILNLGVSAVAGVPGVLLLMLLERLRL
ncbi:MAG: pro-sigmaK processing inhibitor BofA family protein [Oscillospiraceae bacterium]|nr:pro-sigmaK processing inhibitor BofA family protein [Oscillospiraceae bacterium]MCR4761147.1 pro-sigmaK processing inhibitor BofA family protein [Oscillospiraceae bacterium]